ncbi:MAG TPA: DUF819 family protein, partial [Vicinamibacteria bacterium]|nr:DUF819 family protein [Vicinamibacteria bacterium]
MAAIFQLSRLEALKPVFDKLPPLVWTYVVPMVSTSVGILPSASPLYRGMTRYLLPASLVLLVLSSEIRSVGRLGRTALVVMAAAVTGILAGAVVAFLAVGHWLPDDAWQAVGALTATWIGGSTNLVAVATALGMRPELQGVTIVVDTIVGYSWMAVLIMLSGYQEAFDRWNHADRTTIDEVGARLAALPGRAPRPGTVTEYTLMVGLALGLTAACLKVGSLLPPVGQVLTAFSWAIILLTTIAILLSLTPLARLEGAGASTLGYAGFYLLLASVGAQADLRQIVSHPAFVLLGVIMIAVHANVLFAAVLLLRTPLFFFGAAS